MSSKKKTKYLFGKTELIRFITTFWSIEDETFVHPRNKIQVLSGELRLVNERRGFAKAGWG